MRYSLAKKVYLVRGAAKSCIYDIAHNRLLHLKNNDADVLSDLCSGKLRFQWLRRAFIHEMLDNGIIEQASEDADTIQTRDITEIINTERPLRLAWIELTNRCNQHCIHCYNSHNDIPPQDMSIKDFKHVIDELAKQSVSSVILIGGEPFLLPEKDLFAMLAYASKNLKSFELFTNGTLCSVEHLRQIKESYPNCRFALSLHSFIPTEHERVTGVARSYEKTRATISALRELQIPFRCVGTRIEGIDAGEPVDLGCTYHCDDIRISGRASFALFSKQSLEKRLVTEKSFQFSDLNKALNDVYLNSCFAVYIYVSADLNVYPCVMERRLKHGCLRDHSLSDVLKPRLRNFSKDDVEDCKECEFRYLCVDCRPDSVSDNPHAKPWYCTYNVKAGEWLDSGEYAAKLLHSVSPSNRASCCCST